MGLLGLFSTNEERLHQALSEIINEYHQLRSLVQQQGEQTGHLKAIHARMDSINAHIRQAMSLQDREQRRALLHRLMETERAMLNEQKRVARGIGVDVSRIMRLERRAEHATRQFEHAR